MNLEIIHRKTKTSSAKPPLLFVHGAYVGAWCWEEHFLDWFAARGYDAHAVSLRGHGASEGRQQLDDYGLADYAEDVARAAADMPAPPAPDVAERCYRRMQRESRRALLDMSGWSLPPPWLSWGKRRPPTLVLGAGQDALIPAAQAQGAARLLNAEYRLLPDLGHAIMLDAGWELAAREMLAWLEERKL